jgi:transcriptional regulator GlxA family with amidase domain
MERRWYGETSEGSSMPITSTIAIVAYQGVLADETEAFRFVLSRIPGSHLVTVGERRGTVAGPGGVQVVDASFDEIGNPDVVAVPGGLGCHRHVEIARWLRSIEPRWLLASSTGSALLAAAGMLRDVSAATHWLASSILEQNGAHPSPDRLVVAGHIVTCTGRASAFDAALVVARSSGGGELADRIVADLAEYREEAKRTKTSSRRRRHRRTPAPRFAIEDMTMGDAPVVMIDLDDVAPRGRR